MLELLDEYGVELQGANAVVLGRSDIVGKPVALLLLQRHATVTICHSRTRDLAAETSRADVLVAAVGVPGIVQPAMVKHGAAVIDVGITRTEAGLVGDVAPEAAERAGFLTPVPGGVGPMTIAMLLAEHDSGGALPGTEPLHIRARKAMFRALYQGRRLGAWAVASPQGGNPVGSGHRQVVLEREGLRLHRA